MLVTHIRIIYVLRVSIQSHNERLKLECALFVVLISFFLETRSVKGRHFSCTYACSEARALPFTVLIVHVKHDLPQLQFLELAFHILNCVKKYSLLATCHVSVSIYLSPSHQLYGNGFCFDFHYVVLCYVCLHISVYLVFNLLSFWRDSKKVSRLIRHRTVIPFSTFYPFYIFFRKLI
jgi:hypothetical protein